ncbi:MAG: LD-carboxypeptidase [Lachnospiraceae bacterium]|nr:LD-carboxypeptidase [Lachnospiraceae bacterium]
MRIPKPLFKGARVALIAPASGVKGTKEDRENTVARCVETLKSLGLEPVVYPSCLDNYGYLAASDEVRARDVMDAFRDAGIDGIWCLRGGYGVQRILDRLDFNEIRKHPKWFAGYSDITALHIALNQIADMVTYHSVMPSTEVIHGLDDYTMKYLKMALFGDVKGELPSDDSMVPYLLDKKACQTVEGEICGGNLSLVSSSLGTPYEIDTRGKILFLEDIYEGIYRLDGMLNHLRLAEKFRDCKGIILGYWSEVPEENTSMTMEQMLWDLLPHDKPVLMNYSCGHERPTTVLPMGKKARLDGYSKTVTVL